MSSEYYLLKNLLVLVREEGEERKSACERDRQTDISSSCMCLTGDWTPTLVYYIDVLTNWTVQPGLIIFVFNVIYLIVALRDLIFIDGSV